MPTVRAFVAIALPDTVTRRIVERQRQLQRLLQEAGVGAAIRWTAVDNLHLTLRFLGDTTESQQAWLATALDGIAGRSAPLHVTVQGLGCFPSFQRPNIIWLAFQGDLSRLAGLQAHIEQAAQEAGFAPEEKAFKPHLTIGRAQRSAAPGELKRVGDIIRQVSLSTETKTAAPSFTVSAVELLQSDLRPSGPVYAQLASFALGGRPI